VVIQGQGLHTGNLVTMRIKPAPSGAGIKFVRVDRWRPLFANAAQVSSGTSPSELPPIECK